MLKLMYITNDPQTAQIAQQAGVDRIFVDLETVGKEQRQGGMNTVQSHHTVRDVERLRKELTRAALLVRVNPIYPGSEAEIEAVFAGLRRGFCHAALFPAGRAGPDLSGACEGAGQDRPAV